MAELKKYLNERGLREVWDIINGQNSLIVSKIKDIQKRVTVGLYADSTSGWAENESKISEAGALYIYTDAETFNGKVIAKVKIGDGTSSLADLSFIDAPYSAHIADKDIHFTAEERAQWNDEISAFVTAAEESADTATQAANRSETAAQTAKTNADSTAADRQAVQTLAEQVTADKATVADHTAKVAEDRTAAETAAQTAQAVADSLPDDYVTAVGKIAENTMEINNTNTEVSELKGDLVKLGSKTFSVGYVSKTVDSIPNITKVAGKSCGASINDLNFTTLETYDSYYYYPRKDEEFYVASSSLSSLSYIAICTIENAQPISDDRIKGTNGKRFRKSENNLPTEENPLQITKGMAVAFTIPKNSSLTLVYNDVLTDTLNANVVLNNSQINQVLSSIESTKKTKVEYINGNGVDGSTERINIYVPTYIGYIKYEFVHCFREDINCNIWRIGYAYSCDDNLNVIKKLTTTGEWECAVKINGRSDFSGGVAHGDEVVTNIKFFVNGKEISLSDISTISECDVFSVVQYSTLYDPNDSTTVIGYHGSEHIWNENENNHLIIKQSLKWVNAQTLNACYLAMFPVSKTVTDRVFDDVEYNVNTIENLPIIQYKCNELNLYKTSEKFKARFGVSKYIKTFSDGDYALVHDNGTTAYNKCYFVICQNGTVSSGTLWQTETYYNLEVAN